jgi:DNA repair protein RecO (recombination protein O)
MASTHKTEAIVLKKKNLLGKDALITLFTEHEGKIAAVGKGIKTVTSRRASHLQTGNLIEAMVNERNTRYYLQETRLISAFSTIKSNQERVTQQYLFLFILDRILPDRQKEPEVYILLKRFLVDLATNDEFSKRDLTEYLTALLHYQGYTKDTHSFRELLRYIEEIIHEKIPAGII